MRNSAYAIFNNFNFNQAGKYEVIDINAFDMPKIELSSARLAYSDGEKITSKQYGNKTITVSGRILASSKKEADEKADTLKYSLLGIDKNLTLIIADVVRNYTATLDGLSITPQGYHYSFDAVFTCLPYGVGVDAQTISFSGNMTTDSYSQAVTISSVASVYPVINLNILSANSLGSYYLQVKNPDNNKLLKTTKIWNHLDKVQFDMLNKKVLYTPSVVTTLDTTSSTTGWTKTGSGTLSTTTDSRIGNVLYLNTVSPEATVSFNRLNASAVDFSAGVLGLWYITNLANVGSVDLYLGSDATLATNYSYWRVTTQADGAKALTQNSANCLKFELGTAPTGTAGTPNLAAIKSISIKFNATTTFANAYIELGQLKRFVTGADSSAIDYEGCFIDWENGSGTIQITGNSVFGGGNGGVIKATPTATYYKRYL